MKKSKIKKEEKHKKEKTLNVYNKQYKQQCQRCGMYGHKHGDWSIHYGLWSFVQWQVRIFSCSHANSHEDTKFQATMPTTLSWSLRMAISSLIVESKLMMVGLPESILSEMPSTKRQWQLHLILSKISMTYMLSSVIHPKQLRDPLQRILVFKSPVPSDRVKVALWARPSNERSAKRLHLAHKF